MNEDIEETELDEDAPQRRPVDPSDPRSLLRAAVRFFYDLQKLRIQSGNRNTVNPEAPVELSAEDKAFLTVTSDGLKTLERQALKEVGRLLKLIPISEWLLEQKGIGPTMAGVLVAWIDITRADTPSDIWRYCGLAVINGKAERRTKGEKAHFDPWLKSKVVRVMTDSFIKSRSPWKKHYDDYKHRKETQMGPCSACADAELNLSGVTTGRLSAGRKTNGKKPPAPKPLVCENCNGTKIGPWGKSKGHRDAAARRYMAKMLLLELYKKWRELEGLPVRPSYHEEKHGHVHKEATP